MSDIRGLRVAVIGSGCRNSTILNTIASMGGIVVDTRAKLSKDVNFDGLDCIAVTDCPVLPTLLPPERDGGD